MQQPDPKFSPWVQWDKRGSLKTAESIAVTGVYMWARFEHAPDPAIRPYPELPVELIYVGETNDLNARPLGNAIHHRLEHYDDRFPDDPDHNHLYVSVCPVAPFVPRDKQCHTFRAFTRFLEAQVYWEYARRFDSRPGLDYKRGKDEFAL
jgi:hypothetical protein